jgi:hypothetical protein
MRQQACRARRAAGCHALASSPKCRISRAKVREIVDRILATSRTSLVRKLPSFLERFVHDFGQGVVAVTHQPPSPSAGNVS